MGYARPQENFAQLMKDFLATYQPWDYFGTQIYQNYSATVTGTYAVRFVRRRAKKKKPFFLYYAPPQPHAEDTNHLQGIRQGAPEPDPRPSAQFKDTFDDVPLPRTPSFNEADVSDKASNVSDLPLLTDEDIATIQDNYRGRLGALRQVDNQVGRIVDALKKKGEFKNTYMVFISDNGYLQGEHRLSASKFLPFENSVRIPAMIAGPGIKAGREVTGPAMDVDMTATLLKMAGAKPGRTMDGISLLKAAQGKQGLPERDIPLEASEPLFTYSTPITAYDLPYYGVKTPRYKYVNWSFGDKELYDLKNDPDELENLAGDPAMAGLMDELEAEASRLRTCVGTSQCR
jgi:arylsulfatase A-like enzyme